MFKYGKYMLVALLVSGLLAVSYGGCGGGSSDDTSGGGNPNPTNTPTAPPTTDDDIVIPPTNPPDTGACEGDAFNSSSVAIGDCLTDFILENTNDSGLVCFCNASEAGDFILNIAPVFAGSTKLNLEFPKNTDPNVIVPTNFSFDWTAPECNTLELFTTQLFLSDDLISIGTLDNITEIAPDQLTFTANVSDPLLSSALGNSGPKCKL